MLFFSFPVVVALPLLGILCGAYLWLRRPDLTQPATIGRIRRELVWCLSGLIVLSAMLGIWSTQAVITRPFQLLILAVLLAIAGLSLVLAVATEQKSGGERLYTVIYYSACFATAAYYLVQGGFEGDWYRITDVMAYRAEVPFGHRLLFVWAALFLRSAVPGFTDFTYFALSQLAAIALTGWALRKLTGLFVTIEVSRISSYLALLIWLSTFTYYDFYDIGIILFFSLCLYCICAGRWAAYVAAFAIGTLNHEITLLLIPVVVLVQRIESVPKLRIAGFLVLQLAVYALVRAALFHFFPANGAFVWQFTTNTTMFEERPLHVVRFIAPIFLWFALSFAGYRYSPGKLRAGMVILPAVALTTYLFGHYNEPRQFDAFIPIAVALTLCFIQAMTTTGGDRLAEPLLDRYSRNSDVAQGEGGLRPSELLTTPSK
jgi:hypothetical protein